MFSTQRLLFTAFLAFSTLTTLVSGGEGGGRRRFGSNTDEPFQCFKCEEDTEKPRAGPCSEIQTCSGRRPVCAKLEFSAFFHGVMGTKTLKFCYDLVRAGGGRE